MRDDADIALSDASLRSAYHGRWADRYFVFCVYHAIIIPGVHILVYIHLYFVYVYVYTYTCADRLDRYLEPFRQDDDEEDEEYANHDLAPDQDVSDPQRVFRLPENLREWRRQRWCDRMGGGEAGGSEGATAARFYCCVSTRPKWRFDRASISNAHSSSQRQPVNGR